MAEVIAYRTAIDERLQALLHKENDNTELLTKLELGLHHEQQHQELLLMDIKRILGTNSSMPAYSEAHWLAPAVSESWTKFTAGLYEIGYGGNAFAYDNERPGTNTICKTSLFVTIPSVAPNSSSSSMQAVMPSRRFG